MTPLNPAQPRKILVRATNWVGDAVMTLPALEALAQAAPQARIHVLAKPWVAAVYRCCPAVERVVTYDAKGGHAGALGKLRLARELASGGYDWAVLLQNAFEAALLARLAGIATRVGFATDGRGWLLSHPVPRGDQARLAHETSYYLHMLQGAGLLDALPPQDGVPPRLVLPPEFSQAAQDLLAAQGLADSRLLGMAPGAAFGPAKLWPAERFAAAADLLADQADALVLLGSGGEAPQCGEVGRLVARLPVVDLAGATDLGTALGVVARLSGLVSNDSGLMHAAAALGVPTVAVFGSTNPRGTAPLGPATALLQAPVECSPCKKPECARGDMICFQGIGPEKVAQAMTGLWKGRGA